ncbi:ATP-binding protein [Roseinatronobacter sp. NSM]|uniref:ATP-binding protein n=1 Tax=Roseinatronobacter sp. NSM TaxID=3457785 RepID=UPI00403681CD
MKLVIETESSLLKIREVLEAVDVFLKENATHPQLHDDLALVLAEVCSNIARHAYGHDHGKITLHLSLVGDGVECLVRDHGVEFNPLAQDDMPPDPDALCEGGYGWFLIKELTRDLQYSRKMSENILGFFVPGTPLAPVADGAITTELPPV